MSKKLPIVILFIPFVNVVFALISLLKLMTPKIKALDIVKIVFSISIPVLLVNLLKIILALKYESYRGKMLVNYVSIYLTFFVISLILMGFKRKYSGKK